jgi:hypothetical protein
MEMQPSGKSDSTIILPLRKQEHADFLRDLFNGQRGEPIKLTRHEFAGRFIFSLRKYADRPVQQRIPEGMIPVEMQFPDTSNSTHEMSMINKTTTGMINWFMRIPSVSQNSFEELNILNR